MSSILPGLLSFGLPVIALALMAGAVAVFLMIPAPFNADLAAVLVVCAAFVFAYDLGYKERAGLDKSAVLQAQIDQQKVNVAEANRQAVEAASIAAASAVAEHNAEAALAADEKKVQDYATALAHAPNPGCSATDLDVGGMPTDDHP